MQSANPALPLHQQLDIAALLTRAFTIQELLVMLLSQLLFTLPATDAQSTLWPQWDHSTTYFNPSAPRDHFTPTTTSPSYCNEFWSPPKA